MSLPSRLFDRAEDCLYLVRDRFGIKPQYWAMTPEGLVFGSELKVLFAHPAVERRFTSEGLFHQLMQTMVPGTTAFAGVHQVKPGHVLKVQRVNGRLEVSESTYWDVDFPRKDERDPKRTPKLTTSLPFVRRCWRPLSCAWWPMCRWVVTSPAASTAVRSSAWPQP